MKNSAQSAASASGKLLVGIIMGSTSDWETMKAAAKVLEEFAVPYEAKAALCMLMLKDYNMLMVHFVGVPPGGADLLIKFVPPETLQKFGGPKKYAEAVNNCLTKVGHMLQNPDSIRSLLLGGDTVH